MIKQIAFMFLLIFTFAGYAAMAEEVFETCTIDGSIELKAPTQIFCDGDLKVKDGSEIVTNGHGLQIVALGRVNFGTEEGLGLNITAKSQNAGKVFIFAATASGTLSIDNKAQNFGADVEIE